MSEDRLGRIESEIAKLRRRTWDLLALIVGLIVALAIAVWVLR